MMLYLFFAKDCVIHFTREFNTASYHCVFDNLFFLAFFIEFIFWKFTIFPPVSDSLRKLLLSDVTKPQMSKYLSNDCALKLSVYDD